MLRWCEERFEDDGELPAPQPGCACRACRREREGFIPKELREMIHRAMWPEAPFKIPGPAVGLVREVLVAYEVGQIPLEDALVVAIQRLVEYSDKMFELQMSAEMLKPITQIVGRS